MKKYASTKRPSHFGSAFAAFAVPRRSSIEITITSDVSLNPAMKRLTIEGITIDGSSFAFARSYGGPQGAFELSYSGTVEGDELTGQVSTSFGDIPIHGTRAH